MKRYDGGKTILIRIRVNKMRNRANCSRNASNSCRRSHLRAKFLDLAVEIHWSILYCILRITNPVQFKLYTGRAGRPAAHHAGGLGRTQTFLNVSFFPGDCHVYPHLKEVPSVWAEVVAHFRAQRLMYRLNCRRLHPSLNSRMFWTSR
jgi:hypothetical protein